MILKRYIPIAIVAIFGTLTLSAWFIDNETIETFANDDATQFFETECLACTRAAFWSFYACWETSDLILKK